MNPKDDIVGIINNLKNRLEIMERGIAGATIPPAMPAGTVMPYAGASAPTGYLLCDGSAVSRSTYSALYAIIGTTYGAGDGSTTFNLPNLKGKTIVGYNSAETEFDALGETGGAKTHTLTEAQIPSHTHTQNSHYHTARQPFLLATSPSPSYNGEAIVGAPPPRSSASAFTFAPEFNTGSTTATNQNTGGGGAHNNLQPYITLNYVIKS